MTQRSNIPFNVTILEPTPQKLHGLRPVRALDIYEGAGNNFHPDGLFSTLIFGKEGDERRMGRFSYVDIKIPIFHPIIYRTLIKLKQLYGDIISGKDYAVWNPETNDFDRSDALKGKTGFHFFLEHWKDIKFETRKSDRREQNILLISKYANKALLDKTIVMPAGLRDIEVGVDGRTREDEVNVLYRKLITISNTISDSAIKSNPEMLDNARHKLQLAFNEIYDDIENRIEGKKKLFLGKWAGRNIMNGTRNVITAMDTSVPYLGAPGTVGYNDTIVGLYQMLKSIMPVARYLIRNGFLSKVFTDVGAPGKLVNKETLKLEEVPLKPEHFDRWMTDEGIEKVITSFGEQGLRHLALEIEGHYLGLIYKGPDGTFRLMQDIDELPPERDKKHVYPLTFCELLYCSTYFKLNGFPGFVTRYPITGIGSIYPSKAYVKTTTKGELRRELGENWDPMGDDRVAYQFPKTGGAFVNSLVPHSSKLSKLGADFDGDTASWNATYSDEAIREVNAYLATKRAYVGTDGRFTSSVDVMTVAFTLHNLTDDPT